MNDGWPTRVDAFLLDVAATELAWESLDAQEGSGQRRHRIRPLSMQDNTMKGREQPMQTPSLPVLWWSLAST